jgi:SAM-dependent methyltransferase
MNDRDMQKAASCGEPSYVWRDGQQRRLDMIVWAAGDLLRGRVLENGCGIGTYVERLQAFGGKVFGLEYDHERAEEAGKRSSLIVNAAGEKLPYPNNSFDLILSHEVIEHVEDDRAAIQEMIRVLHPGGLLLLFCPNRGYPFETHGIYWRGRYRFGNVPLVNYLPDPLRYYLAPHVRVYTHRSLTHLFRDLPVRFVRRTVIFGAYDNIIARRPLLGRFLRDLLQRLEGTRWKVFGLSHFWVVEKLQKVDESS